MTATFDIDLSTDLSRVRQKIGDVGDGNGEFSAVAAELQDETINYYLETAALAVPAAAAQCAWALAAKWAKMVDVDVDDQLTRASQRHKHYVELAKRLDAEASAASPSASGALVYGGPSVQGLDDHRGPLDTVNPCPWDTPSWMS